MNEDMRRSTCQRCNKHFFMKDMLPGGSFCSTTCLLAPRPPKRFKINGTLVINTIKAKSRPNPEKKRNIGKCDLCSLQLTKSNRHSHKNSKKCKRRQRIANPTQTPPTVKKKKKKLAIIDLWSDANKDRWLRLRYEVLRKYGGACMLCKSGDKKIHVDHIKPKSKYPELAFDITNLQVLCEDCNVGKSNKFEDDWR